MGSSGGKEYKESPETRALTAQQTALLKDIRGTVQQFDPMTFSLLGMKQDVEQYENPKYTKWAANKADYEGAYEKMLSGVGGDWMSVFNRVKKPGPAPQQYLTRTKWAPMTEEERVATLQGTDRQMYDLQQLQYQRLMDAYGGKASISPSLEADLAKQRSLLEQTLAQKLGPNWATSTPGIQAINEFQKQAGLVREEARRAMLSEGQGLLLQNLGYQQGAKQQQLSNLVNTPSARYQANLSSGQELLNSSIAKDNYYNSYKASQSGGVSKGAGAASGALMGAATGAYVGSIVPGIGTAIGAVGGGLIGGIGGLLAGN